MPLNSLPVPKLQLVQVGNYQVPRLDFATEVVPVNKLATTAIYHGPDFNFDRDRRADLQHILVTHKGLYECCDKPRNCLWAMSEWDGIVRAKGVAKTPMLFYRTPYCLDCPCECQVVGEKCWSCLAAEQCGDWLWAWGTVTGITNNNSAEDWKRPSVTEVSLEITLEGPLRRATHQNWWYGNRVVAPRKCLTTEMAISQMHIAKSHFFPPCGPGPCCSRFRFFYRDTATACANCPQYFDSFSCSILWPTEKRYKINSDCLRIFIPGHVPPRVITLFNSYESVRVQNSLYDFTIAPGGLGLTYSDTETGLVYNNWGAWALQPTALDLVRLEPGENVVTSTGPLTLGVLPYWID